MAYRHCSAEDKAEIDRLRIIYACAFRCATRRFQRYVESCERWAPITEQQALLDVSNKADALMNRIWDRILLIEEHPY